MAGIFELFIDAQSRYRFRVVAPDGTVMAVSKGFDDKPAAVAGIGDVREFAGTGLITDQCLATDERGAGAPGCVATAVPPFRAPAREASAVGSA